MWCRILKTIITLGSTKQLTYIEIQKTTSHEKNE